MKVTCCRFLGMVADARSQVQRARYEVSTYSKSQQRHPHTLLHKDLNPEMEFLDINLTKDSSLCSMLFTVSLQILTSK
jgi:hypothetical protein